MKKVLYSAHKRHQFKQRVDIWAGKLQVTPAQVRLQIMRKKWASCSTAGRVSFSLDLVHQPGYFQDYVIVHELLHLKISNHGCLFKRLLSAHLRHSVIEK
jgi:predicted metal-dependent hydrolase